MASMSERLKRERELRGISLRQISEETRIGVRFLEALEEDKLDVIPGEFYRRSYLRAYARYLGLDEDRALNAYDFAKRSGGGEREPSSESGRSAAPESVEKPQRVRLMPSWAKWILLVVGVAAPVTFLLRAMPADTGAVRESASPRGSAASRVAEDERARATDVSPRQTSPFPEEAGPMVSLPVEPRAARERAGTGREGSEMRLVLSVEESCWLEIEADGQVVISGLKDPGFQQEVVAEREVRMWLGNAGGVKLLVNDLPSVPLGRPGQVRKDLTITPENFQEFVAPRDRS